MFKNPVQIVIAWTEEEQEIVRVRRTDLGEAPILRTVLSPRAAMWANKGDRLDLEKAHVYASTNGYRVFVYAGAVRKPLDRARKDVLV